MENLKNMIGSIKRIYNVTKSSEKTIDAMIVDYTYNPDIATHRQHKIDYVTTTGIIGSIFVNDKTSYTDIEISEHVMKNLALIKDSILRKKELQKSLLEESELIEFYTKELLREEEALPQDSFIKDLTSKLSDKSITLYRKDISGQKANLIFDINESIYLEVTLKKHYFKSIRVSTYKNTGKKLNDTIRFAHKRIGRFLDVLNKEKYNDFIKDYILLDSSNIDFIKFLESNNLSLNHNSDNLVDDKDGYVYFKSLDIFEPNDKDKAILLTDNTINTILNLIDFIK